MQPVQHTPNLFRLTRFGAFNCFMVREHDGLTLVDTNLPGSQGRILAAAKKIDAPIRRILITHAHPDHIGSLDALCGQLPGVEVIMGAREARLLAGDAPLDPGEPKARPIGVPRGVRVRPTRTLVPGEHIGSLEAIASPGRTPGHLAFRDVRDGTLLAGDAIVSVFGCLVVAGAFLWLAPLPWLLTWDAEQAYRSELHLRDLKPSRLAPGHGRVVEEPGPKMEQAFEFAAGQLSGRR
jgi:glyoxylase-like metal-dependent hydrolase (beta-lactamase superfamily II)